MIKRFVQWNIKNLPILNKMRDVVNGLDNMRGDTYVNITRSSAGTNIGLNMAAITRRIRLVGNTSGGENGTVIRAACTEDAGLDNIIEVDIFNSDGTAGNPVEVYCNISNGTALNEAVPRLEINDSIYITKTVFDNAGTPEVRWECVSNFQGSEDCLCVQEDAVFNSVTINEDERLTFDGVGGDTYYIYDSAAGEMEHWVDGTKVSSWKA